MMRIKINHNLLNIDIKYNICTVGKDIHTPDPDPSFASLTHMICTSLAFSCIMNLEEILLSSLKYRALS